MSMNKDELIKENKRLRFSLSEEEATNKFLFKQQKELKFMAERAGSEKAKFEQKCVRLEDEINRLKAR